MLHDDYARWTYLSNPKKQLQQYTSNGTFAPSNSAGLPSDHPRANATLVFLCRNSDINGVVSSVQQMEDRFNKRYHYPWVFLNDEPFTDELKKYASYAIYKHNCLKRADGYPCSQMHRYRLA
jgi:alpha 1,2-mannosyltransferase